MEENQRNDAFEAMNEMLSQKKKDNQLKIFIYLQVTD